VVQSPDIRGRTCLCNGDPKCRHDHRLKQDPRWNAEHMPDSSVRWTTPSGRTTPPNRHATRSERHRPEDKLETDGISMPIHGIVQGNSIQFGTVGSTGITYKGTVSGNSMSGTYQLTANGTTFSGPWTAAWSS
jgi:hypothetical protein